MKLKATDIIHVTSVQSEPIAAGATFTVNEAEGKQLIAAGHAKEIDASIKARVGEYQRGSKAPDSCRSGRKIS